MESFIDWLPLLRGSSLCWQPLCEFDRKPDFGADDRLVVLQERACYGREGFEPPTDILLAWTGSMKEPKRVLWFESVDVFFQDDPRSVLQDRLDLVVLAFHQRILDSVHTALLFILWHIRNVASYFSRCHALVALDGVAAGRCGVP